MERSKIRELITLREAGVVKESSLPGFEFINKFDVSRYDPHQMLWRAEYTMYTQQTFPEGVGLKDISMLKQRLEDSVIHFFYGEQLDMLYTLIGRVQQGDKEGSMKLIGKLISQITGR